METSRLSTSQPKLTIRSPKRSKTSQAILSVPAVFAEERFYSDLRCVIRDCFILERSKFQ